MIKTLFLERQALIPKKNSNLRASSLNNRRAEDVYAQGSPGTNSKRPCNFPSTFPQWIIRGEGPYVIDCEGNRYLDFQASLGPNLLGHNHPKIVEAVQAQATKGVLYTQPSSLELDVGELLQEMIPSLERIRFLKNGDDATMAAARIARAHTNEATIVSSGYHGRSDLWVSMTEPALGVKDKFDIEPIGQIMGKILICEPIELEDGEDRKATLQEYRKYSRFLIFDEVVTGFRVPKYTVGQWWDIIPEITCLAKGIANGYPLSVVGGKREVMDTGEYFISSTYSGDCISLAAAKATLEVYKKKNFSDLYYYGNRFVEKLNSLHPEIVWRGYGTRAELNLFESEMAALFSQEMARCGYLFGRGFCYTFAMMEIDGLEERLFNIASDVIQKITTGRATLEYRPRPTFRR